MTFLYDELKRWLKAKKVTALVGRRNDPNRCVLSNFLTEKFGRRTTVRKGAVTVPLRGARLMPEWMCSFYTYMDNSCDVRRPSYTAATALRGLELFKPC